MRSVHLDTSTPRHLDTSTPHRHIYMLPYLSRALLHSLLLSSTTQQPNLQNTSLLTKTLLLFARSGVSSILNTHVFKPPNLHASYQELAADAAQLEAEMANNAAGNTLDDSNYEL